MNAQVMSQLSKVTFKGFMTPMPFKFKPPQDMQQYSQAFSMAEKIAIPDPMALFMAMSTNKYHVDTAKMMSEKFEKYIDGVIAALGGAVDQWAKLATFVNVKVNAITALGTPGCLKGPPMSPLILKDAPMSTPQEQKYSKAIANAVGKAWDNWAKNVQVPGLPWYPAFAAFPGPMAPPMPNIPTPLIVCPSTGMADMSPPKLGQAMVDELGDKQAAHHDLLFKALGVGIGTAFIAWLAATQVMNVLGTGPIPTFAPPVVPVGPVVNGMATGAPGCLVSAPSGAAALKKAGPDSVKALEQEIKKAQQQAENAAKEAEQALKTLNAEADKQQKEFEAANR